MEPAYHRRLGATEQALWLRDRATPLHFVLTAQVIGDLQPASLLAALNRLQQRHPLLRVSIALDQDQHPWFVEQQLPIPCRILQRQGDQHWQVVAAQAVQQAFGWSETPLIRVILLHAQQLSDVIVICHHAIADGLAGVNLIRELLLILSQTQEPLPDRLVPPALETLLPNHRPAHPLAILMAWGWLRLQPRMLSARQPSDLKPAPGSLQVTGTCLPATLTTALMRRCREAGTTVHAAICTAMLYAIATDQNLPVGQRLRCFSPLNLRPYLQANLEEDCGTYIAPGMTTQTVAQEWLFWHTARSLKSELTTQLEPHYLLQLAQKHEVLVGANPGPERLQQIFLERCASDCMVTNLGRLAIPHQFGQLRLQGIYGPVVRSGFAQERVLGVATLGDRLYLTLTTAAANSEILLNQMINCLEQAIAAPELTLAPSFKADWIAPESATQS